MILGKSKARPRRGAQRQEWRFAYFPTLLSDGRWAWLEHYCAILEYSEIPGTSDMFEGPDVGWHVIRRELI